MNLWCLNTIWFGFVSRYAPIYTVRKQIDVLSVNTPIWQYISDLAE